MGVEQLIVKLADLDVRLGVEEGKLKVKAPKGVLTKEIQQEIGTEKEAIIRFLSEPDSASRQQIPIENLPPGQPAPLSYAQQRLWFLDQLEGKSPTYNIPAVLRLDGDLNVESFESAIRLIIQRHTVLRSVYREYDSVPVQVLDSDADFRVRMLDMTDDAVPGHEHRVKEIIQKEVVKPFDLEHDLMLRVTLIKVAENSHVLVLVMHHIASDGWSMGVLVNEFTTAYTAFVQGKKPDLPDLPIQYADFAAWQRKWLDDEAIAGQMKYWREQLEGLPPLLELPTDFPRPAVQTYNGGTVEFGLNEELTRSVRSFCRESGTTPYMLMLAAFSIVLSKYSRQTDVAVGSPIANRTRTELESLIGFFVNTLVIRADVDPAFTFRELVDQLRVTTLEASQNQDIPFERLVDELNPERSLGHQPLFQVLFNMMNAPSGKVSELPGITIGRAENENKIAKFDINLAFFDTNPIMGSLEYNTDLFEKRTIEGLIEHYRLLLENALQNPDQKICHIPLISEEEKKLLLQTWTDTDDSVADDPLIPEIFERQVELTPDRVALVYKDQELTYRQLDLRANCLANYLIEHGAGCDVCVGLCIRRSLDMIVGTLAILKTGSGYVPLDPAYPIDRLNMMTEDAGVQLILADEYGYELFGDEGYQMLKLNEDSWLEISERSSALPERDLFPENICYVTFTSGSTGRPKGSALSQVGLGNMVQWQTKNHPLEPEGWCLQFATINFDVSFQEIFTCWAGGGSLVVATEGQRRDPAALLAELNRCQIVRMNSPVVVLQQLAQYCFENQVVPTHLKQVMTSGDALRVTREVQWLFDRLEGGELHNHYGPSETHLVTAFVLTEDDKPWPPLPSIGKAIRNCQMYIVDEEFRPTPVGVPGELMIGGIQLPRGYKNRPDISSEKLVPNPFSPEPGQRLYRTGDLSRFRYDGNIEFMGRIDHQVKIRGFRVELGEIENVLNDHEMVRNSLVMAPEARPNERYLVAYVDLNEKDGVSSGDLKSHLSETLPDYMVPPFIVFLDEFPKMRNGKVDRKALPQPDIEGQLSGGFVAPVTDEEKVLAGIWCELLKLGRVGISDNFFDIGGHSLMATRVLARIREVYMTDLTVQDLFECPTIEVLARRLEGTPRQVIPKIEKVDRDGLLPMSYAQQRLWFLDRLEKGSATFSMPIALRLSGHLDVDVLRNAFKTIVTRHESLRTTFAEIDGEPVQRIDEAINLDIPLKDVSDKVGGLSEGKEMLRALQEIVAGEVRRPFDLEKGPLMRIALFYLGENDHAMVFNMHHIISDGWSLGIVVNEFVELYRAQLEQRRPNLADLTIQYADFAAWQRQWLSSESGQEHIDYWKTTLTGLPPLLELPTDFPRPDVIRYQGEKLPVVIDAEITQALEQLASREKVTLFMLLMTVFNLLIYRWSGKQDIAVGSGIASRLRSELEGLIGFFADVWVLRTEMVGEPTFLELLEKVKTNTLDAYSHQAVPFDLIVDALRPERSLSYSPIYQVMFLLQNAPSGELELPDLTLYPLGGETGIAKHDLSLNLWPSDGRLIGSMEYSTELFGRDTIEVLIERFRNLLSAVVKNPELNISMYPLQSESADQKAVAEENVLDDFDDEVDVEGLSDEELEAMLDGFLDD